MNPRIGPFGMGILSRPDGVRRPWRIGDGNARRYPPCMIKFRFSDVAHFPSFSTVSVESSYSLGG
jgi:hypothetical protein